MTNLTQPLDIRAAGVAEFFPKYYRLKISDISRNGRYHRRVQGEGISFAPSHLGTFGKIY